MRIWRHPACARAAPSTRSRPPLSFFFIFSPYYHSTQTTKAALKDFFKLFKCIIPICILVGVQLAPALHRPLALGLRLKLNLNPYRCEFLFFCGGGVGGGLIKCRLFAYLLVSSLRPRCTVHSLSSSSLLRLFHFPPLILFSSHQKSCTQSDAERFVFVFL